MRKTVAQQVEENIQISLENLGGKCIILMALQNETGHAINIAHAKLQYDKNMGFGSSYNPPNVLIKSPAFLIKINLAKAANDSVGTIYSQGKVPLSNRQGLFEPLSKLVTRALASLDATEAPDSLKGNAKSIADTIRGHHHAAPTPVTPPPVTPETISTSHLSFINRANNFRTFIALLAAIALYTPSETDITILSMTALLGLMDGANTNIGNTVVTPIENARTLRNHLLYDKATGLIDLAMKAKKYVKSVFGASSPEFALVSGIKYTRPKK